MLLQGRESSIRIQNNARLINVDAGLCRRVNAFISFQDGFYTVFEKDNAAQAWREERILDPVSEECGMVNQAVKISELILRRREF